MEFTVGDKFLALRDQTFIKTCPGFDGCKVATASKLDRNVFVIETVMD